MHFYLVCLCFIGNIAFATANCKRSILLCPSSCSGKLKTCRSRTECDYYEFGSFCSDYCLSSSGSCGDIDDPATCDSYSDCRWEGGGGGSGGGGGAGSNLSGGAKFGIALLVLCIFGGLAAFGAWSFRSKYKHESSTTLADTNNGDGKQDNSSKDNTAIDESASIGGSQTSASDIETGIAENDNQNGLLDRLRNWRQQREPSRPDPSKSENTEPGNKSSAAEDKEEDSVATNNAGTNMFACNAETCVIS